MNTNKEKDHNKESTQDKEARQTQDKEARQTQDKEARQTQDKEGGGRRPTDGSFPACPEHGICRAQSIRTHEACRNCALSKISLKTFIQKQGTPIELLQKIPEECLDLFERLVQQRDGNQESPPFEQIILDIYFIFGKGHIAPIYQPKTEFKIRPGDHVHARLIMDGLKLTCHQFNKASLTCQYIEDLIYCKRHSHIYTISALNASFKRFISPRQCIKRKHKDVRRHLKKIKQDILNHESIQSEKDNYLRKQYNEWLQRFSQYQVCP
jgi:hypothetical protein